MERVKAHKNIYTGEITSVTGSIRKEKKTICNYSIMRGENRLHVVLYDPRNNRRIQQKIINVNFNRDFALKVNKKSVSSSGMNELMRTLSDELFIIYTENMLRHFFGADPFNILEAQK